MLVKQHFLYSIYYKSHITAKGLIGMAPNGFVQVCIGVHVSDKIITKSCGIIDFIEPGDMVMADKDFEIHDSQ